MSDNESEKEEVKSKNVTGRPHDEIVVHDKLTTIQRMELEEAIESGQRSVWIRMWFKYQYGIILTNNNIKEYEHAFMGERAENDKKLAKKIRRRDLIIDVVAELKTQIENQNKRLQKALDFENEAPDIVSIGMKEVDRHMRLLSMLLQQYYRCMQDIGMYPSRELYLDMTRLEKREITFDTETAIIKEITQIGMRAIPDRAVRDNFAAEVVERSKALYSKAREGVKRAEDRKEHEEAEYREVGKEKPKEQDG